MHRTIRRIEQRNSRRVQNEINSRERDATLVRHCLAQDSEKEEEKDETGTIYIELSRERNVGSLACRIIDSIAKF